MKSSVIHQIIWLSFSIPNFSVIVKRDKNTQQTRGYAFITFENPYDAEDAIKDMDKKV